MQRFKHEFTLWLLSKRAGQIVGRAGEGCSCPLANFVRANLAPSLHNPPGLPIDEYVCVGTLDGRARIWARSGLKRQRQADLGPGWARRFVNVLDMSYAPGQTVTAANALRLLALANREPARLVRGGRSV